MGVKVAEPNDLDNLENVFDHNHFRDSVARYKNGQESIQLGQGGFGDLKVRAVAEYNLFERANGDPEAISNKTSDNIYRYNTFRDCSRAELVLRGGTGALVLGNFFFGCKGGVRVHGKGHTIVGNYIEGAQYAISVASGNYNHAPVEDCLIANNTIVGSIKKGLCVGGGSLGGAGPDPNDPNSLAPRRVRIVNNLIVGGGWTLIAMEAGKDLTWQGNIAFAVQQTHGTRQTDPGFTHEGIKAADPKLVKVDGMYRLPTSGSPAQDAGVKIADLKVTDDIDGQPRDDKPDVGCDEVSDKPVTRRPLEPKDVGPTWMKGDPSRVKRIDSPKPIPKIEKAK
jgi:poly(beta-D-mannuronate) lyase